MAKDKGLSVALFPASFDPITNGHLDLIYRARRIFDEVVVAIASNVGKEGTFSVEERLEMLHEVLDGESGIRIGTFEGLVVTHAKSMGARGDHPWAAGHVGLRVRIRNGPDESTP